MDELSRAFAGRKFQIVVYGCQMNVSDAERYRGILRAAGGIETAVRDEADMILYLTCCVRENAERRVFGNVGALREWKAARADRVIAVAGCMPQQPGLGGKLMKRWPFVDILLGTHNVADFPSALLAALQGGGQQLLTVDSPEPEDDDPEACDRTAPYTAFLPVMRGCDNFCAYCVVPYVRGRERSVPPGAVMKRAEALLADGVAEISLLGQNVNSYSSDSVKFPQLLTMVAGLGVPRVRFMTSHPKDLSDALLEAMASSGRIAPHIHLPVQSGSDGVLRAMNRGYTAAHYLERVARAREILPDIGLTSDIIVGFPGETDADFERTLDLVERVGYDGLYMFAYSPRAGTPAADMPGQIPEPVKKERLARLIGAQAAHTARALVSRVGKTESVLFTEKALKRDDICGRTARGMTLNAPAGPDAFGRIAPVRVTAARRGTLYGEYILEDHHGRN